MSGDLRVHQRLLERTQHGLVGAFLLTLCVQLALFQIPRVRFYLWVGVREIGGWDQGLGLVFGRSGVGIRG